MFPQACLLNFAEWRAGEDESSLPDCRGPGNKWRFSAGYCSQAFVPYESVRLQEENVRRFYGILAPFPVFWYHRRENRCSVGENRKRKTA